MVLDLVIFKQIIIFFSYSLLSFGMTRLITFFARKNPTYNIIISSLLLVATLVFLILGFIFPVFRDQGFIKYGILAFFALLGSIIALLVTLYPIRK